MQKSAKYVMQNYKRINEEYLEWNLTSLYSIDENVWRPIETVRLCARDISDKFIEIARNYYDVLVSNEPYADTDSKALQNCIDAIEKMSEPVFSGWSFVSLEQRIEKLSNGISLLPFVKSDEYHRIFLRFIYLPESFSAEAMVRQKKKMIQKLEGVSGQVEPFAVDYLKNHYILSDSDKDDDIVITVNLTVCEEEKKYLHNEMFDVIAHELQHIIEQYVFSDDSCLKRKKNTIAIDFVNDNRFENFRYRNEVYNLLNLIIPTEIRARLTQLVSILDIVAQNKPEDYIREVKFRYNQYRDFSKAVMYTEIIQSVTHINSYVRRVKALRRYIDTKDDKMKILAVVALYMLTHNFVMINDDSVLKELERYVFGDKTASNNIIYLLRQCLDKIENILDDYIRDVDDTISEYKVYFLPLINNINEHLSFRTLYRSMSLI